MSRTLSRLLPGLVLLVVAVALLLWPLHADGVRGNALRPSYSDTGWFAYAPLPDNPTPQDLRAGGVRLPQDVVRERRRLVAGVAAVAFLALAAGLALRSRRTDPLP